MIFSLLYSTVKMLYYSQMLPVLVNIGSFPVSSFGLFLGLGIFFGAFSVWRIARSFDYDSEKILDIIFLTTGIGFLFSRLLFAAFNLGVVDSFARLFFLNRYPGLSFWGGFLGGILGLWWLSKRNKVFFFQAADIAIAGFFIGAFFAEIGCLLGACGVGIPSTAFYSVDQVGVIGKRLPIQLVEAAMYLFIFWRFWKAIIRFHIQGAFFAKGSMYLGLIKFGTGFFKEPGQALNMRGFEVRIDPVIAVFVFCLGIYVHYKVYKKTPVSDLALFFKFFVSRNMQKSLMTKIFRGCYNQWVNLIVGFGRLRKKLFKSLNIRSNPESFHK